MIHYGWIISAIAIVLVHQDRARPATRRAEGPATQRKILPFPKHEARWVVHGKVKADTMIQPRKLAVQATVQQLRGKTVEDPSRLCNAKNLTLPNVLVVVSKVGNTPIHRRWQFEVPEDPVLLDQVRCQLVPHVIALMTGQELRITNSDDILHNVHWRGRKNPRFNFAHRKGERTSKWFAAAESSTIGCDIHPWTRCLVHILSHPVFAVSDEHGRFSLPKLPDGDYELVATHELLGKITQKIKIEGKPRKWVIFVFKVPGKLRAPK
ncbi:MAG: hypothetical protein ACE5F1_07985 [Planctomycetota bacterium]